ncbi:ATP synthase F1 subunit epsilon [Peptococcus simiae]|uniref:ATP synthase F1 subunit epsilon n=1 Tax=Peptococcus simiae TaxID=1643805 RepID=UPI003980BFCC
MAENKIHLDVVTPRGVALNVDCDLVVVSSTNGEMGFMANHAPTLAALIPQVVRYTIDGQEKVIFVSGGFVEVNNNTVSIMALAAETSSEIDFKRAEEAKARAIAQLKEGEHSDRVRAEAALARANARLKMSEYHHG